MKSRIGVYICHCGGNISDYVDVEQLGKMFQEQDGVVIAKDVMFACADSNQKAMINDIKESNLDAIVVASCSPKLHLHTFRNVASRAGLNPSNYVQVNIREQCSWPHSDNPKEATVKAAGLIRAGIHRVAYSESLDNIEIPVTKAVMVIGAGVAGMKAALDLARLGNEVYLVEKESFVGGHIAYDEKLFMSGQNGKEIVESLYREIKSMNNITLFTGATISKVSGSLGNFHIDVTIKPHISKSADQHINIPIAIGTHQPETLSLITGAVLVATGYDYYQPKEGEYGYKTLQNVLTLPEFKRLMESNPNKLVYNGKQVRKVAFIYCVGNRQSKGESKYCSRQCCTSTIYTSIQLKEKYKDITAFHLYRDIRTYGKQEILYEQSSKQGDLYFKFEEKEAPVVEQEGKSMLVKFKDYLTSKMSMELEADMVVLVTGMVAREDSGHIAELFKIPVGNDKFFNEIHPKLKPVETVIKGVYIGGSCQSPKNISESVQSSLSASAKINALLKKGSVSVDPVIARVNSEACSWCGKCAEVCDYTAIKEIESGEKHIAAVNEAVCAGCGICAPVCPENAIEIAKYTDHEIESMIDGFMERVEIKHGEASEDSDEDKNASGMKEYPQIWKNILQSMQGTKKSIPEIAEEIGSSKDSITWHMMTMNKYNVVAPAGMDDNEEYYYYKIK